MSERIVGEFRPPRELAMAAAARVSGRGVLLISQRGLTVEGEIHDGAAALPLWVVAVPLALVAIASRVLSDEPAQILGPVSVLAILLYFWSRFRAEYGRSGTFELVWSDVEHVVRMPSDPDVLGFVLCRPLAGAGSPEQVFFAPTLGVEALVGAIRRSGPTTLTIDLESAERPVEVEQGPAD